MARMFDNTDRAKATRRWLRRAILPYLMAIYISELVFKYLIWASDPYPDDPFSTRKWELFICAPLIAPLRYVLVAWSTYAGGRESFEQLVFAIPFATFVSVFLFSLLARCWLCKRRIKENSAASGTAT